MTGTKVNPMATQQPIERFRAGPVSCALWRNEVTVKGERKSIVKASVSRRYRDRNDEWQTSQSFSRNEIPLAIYCLQKAFGSMIENAGEPDTPAPVE
jgi:hypothetical protein